MDGAWLDAIGSPEVTTRRTVLSQDLGATKVGSDQMHA